MELIATYFAAIQPHPLLVFGLIMLLGVGGGIISNRFQHVPTITAFMLLGFIAGPYGLGLITHKMLADSSVIIDIALGLILYKLGNMLHPEAMLRSKRLMLTSVLESAMSFVPVFLLVIALGYDKVVAALIGAIAISSSPAILVHVAEEMHARGQVTSLSKSLVALNNLFSFLVFSTVLPFAMTTQADALSASIIVPAYQLFGAVLIGIAVAWLAVRITRFFGKEDAHFRFAVVIGAVMLTLGLCTTVSASALFAPLVLGIATRWFETSKHNLSRVGFGEGGDLFFIALFVMAGAKINPAIVIATGIAPLLIVIVRTTGKAAGIFLAAPQARLDTNHATATSLLLLPMAGMAIGLAATLSQLAPGIAVEISAIIFAMVAIFETIGPFAATHAFLMTGEAGQDIRAREENAGQQPPQQNKPKDGQKEPAKNPK